MAYWHHPDGSPAPWGEGRFDPSHLLPLLLWAVLVPLALAVGR